jgi:TetR/AcrR family transcriptional regulator, cholesterol catabolism regulator
MTAEMPSRTDPRLPIGGSALQRRIADAAIELFYAQGSVATTVREIASACGLTAGALYNHFSSKEQLLYVLVRDVHVLAIAQIAAAVQAAAPDPVSQLAAMVRVLVSHTADAKKQSRVANREYTSLTGDRRQEIRMLRRELRDQFAAVLQAGADQGVFMLPGGNDAGSAALTASTVTVMCVHISERTLRSYPFSAAELQDRYAEMALRMVGARLD